MRGFRTPFGPHSGLDLGVDHREINAGVTTSHLRRAVAENVLRSAAAAAKTVAEPTKTAAPVSTGVKTAPGAK